MTLRTMFMVAVWVVNVRTDRPCADSFEFANRMIKKKL